MYDSNLDVDCWMSRAMGVSEVHWRSFEGLRGSYSQKYPRDECLRNLQKIPLKGRVSSVLPFPEGPNTRLQVSHQEKPSLYLYLSSPFALSQLSGSHTFQLPSCGGCKERRSQAAIPFPPCRIWFKVGRELLVIMGRENVG